ncbi:MAG: hypothetical protein A2Z89_07865 [Deltaproteobacteria bacterium GWA2_43_19]|nr:MAG: hypothetical protein A2Z89_07865 [Deltaproteobacteria bacterium GWA2_43_19]
MISLGIMSYFSKIKEKFVKPARIKAKLIAIFFILAILPITIAGIYGIYYSAYTLEDTTLRHLEYELSSKAKDIEKFLKTVHRDVLFLSQTVVMRDMVDLPPNASIGGSKEVRDSKEFQRLRERLERAALIISQTRPYYYQIRYIDENGHEVVRVDSDGDKSTVVSSDKLQNKGDRYYFTEAMKYPNDQSYVSPMDLNVERGEIELPHKPVVRVATPVFDSPGSKKGIVIINLYASYLIQQMQSLNIAKGGTTFLVNKDGFYLSHLNSQESDSKYFGLGSTKGLSKDYSIDIVNQILSGKPGTIRNKTEIASYIPIFTGDNISKEFWVLAISYPKKAIFAPVFRMEVVFLIIGFFTLFAAIIVGILMARRVTKPILELHKGVEWIASGDFEHTLNIRTGDEIEELAAHFNKMTLRLRDYRARTMNWNEFLQEEVTKRTRELEVEKNKLENVLMCATDGIIVADEGDRIIILNPAAESILGVKGAGMMGKDIFSCHKDLEKVRQYTSRESAGIPQTFTASIDSRTLEVSMAVINYKGEKFGSMMVIRDITERQRLIEERMTMERQLFHADKLVSLGELSAGVAHEIGNPLAAIKTVIQAMDEEMPFMGEQKKYMKRILREVDRLTLFLKTFSAFAHTGTTQSAKCRVDQVLKDVIFLIRNEAQKHDIRIDYTVAKDIPEVVIDSDQLKQVFMNLFLNAIQAIQGGGKIAVSITRLYGRGIKVSVSDTGHGIPQEIIVKIFDPFFTTKQNGTGLGLSIVHRIIKENNGDIKVMSEVGRGTTFDVILPVVNNELRVEEFKS